jgi:hypothetical protein
LAAKKVCPKCGSDGYRFRSSKIVPATASEPETIAAKYRCEKYKHEWSLRVAKA